MRALPIASLLLALPIFASAQSLMHSTPLDSDHDGLPDATETALLRQFVPHFLVSRNDCSTLPAQFVPFLSSPVAQANNGTIYGQAFPRRGHADQIELHYYHLWRVDCGRMGHDLDAEHVSALLDRKNATTWQAVYWYAAAHEDTVCDASQITRASTLHAELHGPRVWISNGKHASFLSNILCTHGCGADRCRNMKPLAIANLINVGELSVPMNGASWIASPKWPLADKLQRSDFSDARTTRLTRLPATDIAWANPEKRPMQAAILGGSDAIDGGATGFRATDTALVIAHAHTGNALHRASDSTGNALANTYRSVKKALQSSVRQPASNREK